MYESYISVEEGPNRVNENGICTQLNPALPFLVEGFDHIFLQFRVLWVTGDADIGVAVTLAPPTNNEMGDAVVVGLKNFRISEHFISKCIQISQRNSRNVDV